MEVINSFSVLPYMIKSKPIGHGTTAICFKREDGNVFKCFKDIKWADERFKTRLPEMDGISNNSYIGPEKLLYVRGRIRGYFYPYVEGKPLSSVSSNIRLFELFKGYDTLLKDTKLISDKGFILQDVNSGNIILNDGIKIIDIDRGYFKDTSKEAIYINNAYDIFQTIFKYIYKASQVELILPKEKIINDALSKMHPNDIDSVNEFLKLICDVCEYDNPKLKEIRKTIGVEKHFDEYHYNK